MSRSFVRLVAGFALVAAPMVSVQAQSACVGQGAVGCSLVRPASLTIPKLVRLGITGASITLNTPDFATDSLNDQEVVTNSAAFVSVRSNTNWVLSVSTLATEWTYAGSEGGARTLAQLQLESACGLGVWGAISSSAQQVAAGGLTNGASASICVRTVFPSDYTDAANRPGVYTLPLTISLTAP